MLLVLTKPVTTCTSERSFSMWRLTNHTKSSMAQNKLNNLIVLNYYTTRNYRIFVLMEDKK